MLPSAKTEAIRASAAGAALAALRRGGLRISSARRLIVHALAGAASPRSAAEVAADLGQDASRIDLTTIYRNLETLEQAGVVARVHLGEGPARYLLVDGEEREFIACERCGCLTQVEPSELDAVRAEIERRFGYRARFRRFPIVGVCPVCVGREQPRS